MATGVGLSLSKLSVLSGLPRNPYLAQES